MELPKFYGTSAYTLTGPFTTARGSCPNIVLIDKVDSRVKIIDIAVLWDANIESKYGEKVDHYKYLAIELSSLEQKRVTWHVFKEQAVSISLKSPIRGEDN